MNIFSSPFGDYELVRHPATTDKNLQAWDSADRLVLTHLADIEATDGLTVICNDAFGALTTALSERQPLVWNDSALAHHAVRSNMDRNQLSSNWTPVRSVEDLPVEGRSVSLVVLKVPKSLTFLEDQLARLATVVDGDTSIVGAAKAKHIHTSTLQLFEKYLGPTTTSLAKQKSRLIFCSPDITHKTANPWPQNFDYAGRALVGHAGVFSHRKLDQGTRVLVEHMKRTSWLDDASTIVDLGCGNGLLGLQAVSQNENIRCIFTDSSYMAVDSARINAQRWFPDATQHRFVVSDCLAPAEPPSGDDSAELVATAESVDLVLCNPPFHDNYVMGQETATKMFQQSAQVLTPTGRLVVVANRHLHYTPILKRLFSSVEVETSTKKFVVLVAEQPR